MAALTHSESFIGFMDDLRDIGKFKMLITAGNHAGAQMKFAPSQLTIGAAQTADIVLFADDIADNHCRIVLGQAPMSTIEITALDAPIMVNGAIIEPGTSVKADGEVVIKINNAELVFSSVINLRTLVNAALSVLIAIIAAVLLVLALRTAGNLYTVASNAASKATTNVVRSVNDLGWTGKNTRAVTEGPRRSGVQVLGTVRSKLNDLDISTFIRASAGEDETITVEGTIPQSRSGSWREFLRWYDSNTAFPRLVRQVSRAETPADVPQLQSVWMVGEPRAYFADGSDAGVGEFVNGAWRIVEIEKTGVVVERDGLPVRLTF